MIVYTFSNGIVLGDKGNTVFLQWHSHQMFYGIFTIKLFIIMFGDSMESNRSCKCQRLKSASVFFKQRQPLGRTKAWTDNQPYPPLCLPSPLTPLLLPFRRVGAPNIIGGALMGRRFTKPLNSAVSAQQCTSPSSAKPIICCTMWNFKEQPQRLDLFFSQSLGTEQLRIFSDNSF